MDNNASKWITSGDRHYCSNCDSWALYDEYDESEILSTYCPSCGKRMENAERKPDSLDMCQELDGALFNYCPICGKRVLTSFEKKLLSSIWKRSEQDE